MSYHSAVHPNDAAQRLALYKSVVQQWSANLFELDEHATYRLLAAGDMSGVTGDRGNRIVASAPALWAWLGLLRDRVEEIEQMGESKTLFDDKTTEIEELIIGKNISISRSSLPDYLPPVVARKFKDRDGDPIDLETNCHGLVETFRAVYNPVRDIVAEVDAVWSDLIPRIEAATTTLDRANAVCDRLGATVPEVRLATQRLEAVRASVSDDPLSLSGNVGPDLDDLVANAARAVGELEKAHGSLSEDLASTDVVLAELRVLRARAAAAYSEAAAKVAGVTLVRVPSTAVIDGPNGLAHRARRFDSIEASDGEWRDARALVDDWQSAATRLRQQLERALEVNQDPLKRRDDLRALLRAYQVKASMTSDIAAEVADLGQLAHDELYTSPTDLKLAQDLMDRFASALSG